MTTQWLTEDEQTAWIRFAAVLELLPGVLDAQLGRDEGLTHFDYFALAMLSEAPGRTLRMTTLARRTNATLPRLSRVMNRLEGSGYVERRPCPDDGRATDVVLTEAGLAKVVRAAPGHVETVRTTVLGALTPDQVAELSTICVQLLTRLDPEGKMFARSRAKSAG